MVRGTSGQAAAQLRLQVQEVVGRLSHVRLDGENNGADVAVVAKQPCAASPPTVERSGPGVDELQSEEDDELDAFMEASPQDLLVVEATGKLVAHVMALAKDTALLRMLRDEATGDTWARQEGWERMGDAVEGVQRAVEGLGAAAMPPHDGNEVRELGWEVSWAMTQLFHVVRVGAG